MRPFVITLIISLIAGPVAADPNLSFDNHDFLKTGTLGTEFKLGGAVSQAILPPSDPLEKASLPRMRLSIPKLMRETGLVKRKTPFGGFSVTLGESWNGRDVFHLGTSLTRGATTAGLNLSYEETDGDVTGSELFIDYALTKSFSIGLSSILSDDVTLDSEPIPQVGLNAEIAGAGGVFLQGGITDADETKPIFGLALGLKF